MWQIHSKDRADLKVIADFETSENWEQENQVTIIKLSDSQSSNHILIVLQKIKF